MKAFFALLLAGIFAVGCLQEGHVSKPDFLPTSPPVQAHVDFSLLEKNCAKSYYGSWDCTNYSAFAGITCRSLEKQPSGIRDVFVDEPDPLVDRALTPGGVFLSCRDFVEPSEDTGSRRSLYSDYALPSDYKVYTNYLVVRDGGVKVIDSVEAFKHEFAPVDSPGEAMAFVRFLERDAFFNFDGKGLFSGQEGRYFVTQVRGSRAEKAEGGFNVFAFKSSGLGCYKPSVVEVEYFVSGKDASITKKGESKIFEADKESCLVA